MPWERSTDEEVRISQKRSPADTYVILFPKAHFWAKQGPQNTKGKRSMNKPGPALLGLLLAVLTSMPVNAQVTLDVSKITCEQFWLRKVADPDKVALWISGYVNGKRGNTVIDTQQLGRNVRRLTDYCRENYKMTVMQAVEALITEKKIQ